MSPGDLVILIAYGVMNEQECKDYDPRVVFVDADNRQVELGNDPAHAPEGSGLITPAHARHARLRFAGVTVLLAVDVRNTNIVLGLFTGSGSHSKLQQDWRVRTDAGMTGDELALLFRGLLGADVDRITAVSALSTVPSVLRELRGMLGKYWAEVPHVVVEPGVRTGVPLLVDNPKEVGADRIVNSLAAHHFYGGPCIVVDFGTSTCVDVVSGKGEFLGGGAIAPGVEISMDALASQSAALRKVELTRPRGGWSARTPSNACSPVRFSLRRHGRRSRAPGAFRGPRLRSRRCRGDRHGRQCAADHARGDVDRAPRAGSHSRGGAASGVRAEPGPAFRTARFPPRSGICVRMVAVIRCMSAQECCRG